MTIVHDHTDRFATQQWIVAELRGWHDSTYHRHHRRGSVWCWGRNNDGELGDGTTTSRLAPVDVQGLRDAVPISADGSSHTCALRSGGKVVCWGHNGAFQLPLSALQLAIVIGPEQIEVGQIHPTGVVQTLEVIPNADGLAPLARVAERLYTTRDPNAYGKVGALLYAHDEAPVGRVVAVASSLMGPKCGPAEHAAEASPACWFNVRLEGRRASLERMKLDRW